MIVAFDFDGTLANIEHRLHFIQSKPEDWPAFFRACVNDTPIMPVIHACQAMVLAGHGVEVWSGRSDIVRTESELWLNRHAIGYKTLRMRQDGDYRQDAIVKAEWLAALPEAARPALAFDGRQQVVDMWRAHGIRCCQVAPGDF
jgi:hypothetical protein